jgi:hypothetical protein
MNEVLKYLMFLTLIAACQSRQSVDFNTQIKPIINKKCISCHGGVKQSAGFSLLFQQEALGNTDEGTPAIIPGNANKSRIIQRFHEKDPELRMPFENPPLSKEEIDLFTKWINQGANWGTHWAYISPEKFEIPKVGKSFDRIGFLKNPIDNFIAAQLEEKKLVPNGKAEKNILARRVAFDITGLPPKVSLFENFINGNITYEKYVDRLLDSKSYGEKWASWWLDLARYADSRGYEGDGDRVIWKYRDWVIKALNNDMPFDQFTIEQLAGDLLENPTPDNYIATAFNRNTMNNDEGGTNNEEFRTAAVIDRVNTTFDALQSTTMSCVQCHSHPYDPIKHDDYYKLMAFFNNTKDSDQPVDESPVYISYNNPEDIKIKEVLGWIKTNGDIETYNRYKNLFYRYQPQYQANFAGDFKNASIVNKNGSLLLRNNGSAILINIQIEESNRIIINYKSDTPGTIVKIRNGSSNGRILTEFVLPEMSWIKNGGESWRRELLNIPIKKISGKIDLHISAHDPIADFRKITPPSSGVIGIQKLAPVVYLNWFSFAPDLPGEGKKGYSLIKKYVNEILTTTKMIKTPIMIENEDYHYRSTYVFDRGNWLQPTKEVKPDVPKSLNSWKPEWGKNRLGFAQWIVDRENSLTSRTVVNRIWNQVFGRGIVSTIEDMGTQSEPPSHPALLDWMSVHLMEDQKWSLKSLIRSIVLSGTYQQNSTINENNYQKDPLNIYYARGTKLRLKAEEVRDQALAVSGLLSPKIGGPAVKPPQPKGFGKHRYGGSWVDSEGDDRYRRAVYTYLKRTMTYPSFLVFDAGTREVCLVNRISTNTPLQALITMNDPVYVEAAYHLAKSYLNKENIEDVIKAMYKKATFKKINNVKLESLVNLYNNAINQYENDPESLKEFLDIEDTNKHHAGLTIVASAIMNLDEFLTHA